MRNDLITMLQIDYFLAVAKYSSFTKAAMLHYTSQPNLSKQITGLEEHLGVDLFIRSHRTVTLTPCGEKLLELLEPIVKSIDEAVESIQNFKESFDSIVRIGFYENIRKNLFFREFSRKYIKEKSNTTLLFESVPFELLREGLISDRFSAIITLSFDVQDWKNINSEVVYASRGLIVYSKNHKLAKNKELKLEDFKDETFCHVSKKESVRAGERTYAICQNFGFEPKTVREFPNVDSVLMAVELGAGVAVFDETIEIGHEEALDVFVIPEDAPDLVCVWKKDNETPELLRFIKNLKQSIKVYSDKDLDPADQ